MLMFLSVNLGSYNFKVSYAILKYPQEEKSIVIIKRIRQKYQSILTPQDIKNTKDSEIRKNNRSIKHPKAINKVVIENP